MLMLGFATVLLAPVILLLAMPVCWLANRLHWIPAGVPWWLAWLLISGSGYGVLYLHTAADSMILKPSLVQRESLGAVEGSPFALTKYQFEGFQDPSQRWEYRLAPARLAALRKRCLPDTPAHRYEGCVLFAHMDDRAYTEITIEGDRLVVHDGLW